MILFSASQLCSQNRKKNVCHCQQSACVSLAVERADNFHKSGHNRLWYLFQIWRTLLIVVYLCASFASGGESCMSPAQVFLTNACVDPDPAQVPIFIFNCYMFFSAAVYIWGSNFRENQHKTLMRSFTSFHLFCVNRDYSSKIFLLFTLWIIDI